mmetsp:Transcript_29778/g.78133  ORF Transcript_29778/g.78133 Transcript_29778/m.78133 type:complete len:216 (+) Transcript_29778:447-1094(+)
MLRLSNQPQRLRCILLSHLQTFRRHLRQSRVLTVPRTTLTAILCIPLKEVVFLAVSCAMTTDLLYQVTFMMMTTHSSRTIRQPMGRRTERRARTASTSGPRQTMQLIVQAMVQAILSQVAAAQRQGNTTQPKERKDRSTALALTPRMRNRAPAATSYRPRRANTPQIPTARRVRKATHQAFLSAKALTVASPETTPRLSFQSRRLAWLSCRSTLS